MKRLIEPLLPVYQSVLKVPVVILDQQANDFYKSAETNPTYYTETLRNVVDEYTSFQSVAMIESPFSFPIGTKYLIVSLSENDYLLAGPFVTSECDKNFPKLSDQEVESARQRLSSLQKILQQLNSEKKQVMYDILSLAHELTNVEQQSDILDRTWFYERMVSDFSDLDFAGIARPTMEDSFEVTSFFGSENVSLEGYKFSFGQGFLGQASISKNYKVWNQVEHDLRNGYLHPYGLRPKALFCYPLLNDNQCVGLVFGGTTLFHEISLETSFVIRHTFEMIEQNLTIEALNTKLYNVNTRLQVLKEIFSIISNMKDLRQIAYVLIDMTMVLVKSKFSSVFVHQQANLAAPQLYARGISQDLIEQYTQSIKARYVNGTVNPKNMAAQKWQTPWNEFVYEFPLVRNERFIGLLTIHLPDEQTDQQVIDLVASISQVGAVTIDLIGQEQKNAGQDQVANFFTAVEAFKPEHYHHSQKMLIHIQDFASVLDFSYEDITLCKEACMLSAYSESFLLKQQIDPRVVDIIVSYNQLNNGKQPIKKSRSPLGHFLYIVDYFAEHQAFPETKTDIQQELVLRLSTFTFRQTLESDVANAAPVQQKEQLDLGIIKNQFNLSKRELEVLEHVIAGIHNSEIAATLFISEHTVKNHITSIFRKLQVRDRSEAIAKSYRLCLEQ